MRRRHASRPETRTSACSARPGSLATSVGRLLHVLKLPRTLHVLTRIPSEKAEPHDFRLGKTEEFRVAFHFLQKLCFAVVEFDGAFVPCLDGGEPGPFRLIPRIAAQRPVGFDF